MAIKTKNEVVEWAKSVYAEKGEKFTPLSKADLYAIASWIVEVLNAPVETPDEAEGKPEAEKPVETVESPGASAPNEEKRLEGYDAPGDEKRQPKRMTIREWLKREGKNTPQAVFDEFLKWKAKNEKTAFVMDFSNGMKLPSAAFAWWLGNDAEEMLKMEDPRGL